MPVHLNNADEEEIKKTCEYLIKYLSEKKLSPTEKMFHLFFETLNENKECIRFKNEFVASLQKELASLSEAIKEKTKKIEEEKNKMLTEYISDKDKIEQKFEEKILDLRDPERFYRRQDVPFEPNMDPYYRMQFANKLNIPFEEIPLYDGYIECSYSDMLRSLENRFAINREIKDLLRSYQIWQEAEKKTKILTAK